MNRSLLFTTKRCLDAMPGVDRGIQAPHNRLQVIGDALQRLGIRNVVPDDCGQGRNEYKGLVCCKNRRQLAVCFNKAPLALYAPHDPFPDPI